MLNTVQQYTGKLNTGSVHKLIVLNYRKLDTYLYNQRVTNTSKSYRDYKDFRGNNVVSLPGSMEQVAHKLVIDG